MLLFGFSTDQTTAQGAFITTWDTGAGGEGGQSGSTEIRIPINENFGGEYNYCIDWDNDGTSDTCGVTGSILHDFGAEDVYTIRIEGDFPAIAFNNSGDKLKLLSVDQWGDIEWGSMRNAFNGCKQMEVFATDTPDLTNVRDMSWMFHNAQQMNANLSHWNVSGVEEMYATFSKAWAFNGDISGWQVGNVTEMSEMFFDAISFNRDLSDWDVSKVKFMRRMFGQARKFNGNIRDWKVSQPVDMRQMFKGATDFDQSLGKWEISTAHEVSNMLQDAGLSISSYEATLAGWRDKEIRGVSLGNCSKMRYCDGEDRAFLIHEYGWNIYNDQGPVDFSVESIEPVRFGNDGVIQVVLKDEFPPLSLALNGIDYDASQDTVKISGVSSEPQKLEITDSTGCTEVYWVKPAVITTICDFSSQLISTSVVINQSLTMPRLAPETLFDHACVQAVFDPEDFNSLYVRTYLYEPGTEEVTLKFGTDTPNDIRAFVFTCEQYDDYSVDNCLSNTGISDMEELPLGVDEPFYYIVIAGKKNSEFTLLLDSGDDLGVCGAVSGSISCGDALVRDSVSETSLFDTEDLDRSPYEKCYDGGKSYTGGEKVFDLNLQASMTITLGLDSDSDMGLFLFNYDCTRRCIFYSTSSDGPDSIDLTAGYYFVVVDHNISGGSDDRKFDLTIDCKPLVEQLWPDRRTATCLTAEPQYAHTLMFSDVSMNPLLEKFPQGDESSWLLSLLSPDFKADVGDPKEVPFGQPFSVIADADSIGDDMRCGYVPEEQISYAIRMTDRHETVYCTGFYAENSDTIVRFQRGEEWNVQQFYQTRGTIVKHSEIDPPSLPFVQGKDTVVAFIVKANQEWDIMVPSKEWIKGYEVMLGTGQDEGIGTSTVELYLRQNDDKKRSADISVQFDDGTTGIFAFRQLPCEGSCTSSSAYPGQLVDEFINVFPNPTGGDFEVRYQLKQPSNVVLRLIDMNGQLVDFKEVTAAGTEGSVHFDAGDLASGMYLVHAQSAGISTVKKVVLSK